MELTSHFLRRETSQSLPITSCQLNLMRGKAWKIMSVIAEFLHWHHERWNVRTALPFQLGSRFITVAMYWSISRIELDWVDQTFVRSARSWIDYQHLVYLTTLADIYLPTHVQHTSHLHISFKWQISTDWCQKITSVTWSSYQLYVTQKVYSSLFYCSWSNCWRLLSHYCYFDSIWIYLSRSPTGETFQL